MSLLRYSIRHPRKAWLAVTAHISQSLKQRESSDWREVTSPTIRNVHIFSQKNLVIALDCRSDGAPNEKAGVLSVTFFDKRSRPISGRYRNFSNSSKFPNYHYLAAANDAQHNLISVIAPPKATRMAIEIHPWIGGISIRNLAVSSAGDDNSYHRGDLGIEAAVAKLRQQGAIVAARDLLARHFQKTASNRAKRMLEAVNGELEELSTEWLPALARIEIRPSDAICHLFKVAYPFENSGGAIRGLNTVRSQMRLGLDPYVILPLGYPDGAVEHGTDATTESRKSIEGVDHYMIGEGSAARHHLHLNRRTQLDTWLTASTIKKRGAAIIHAASGYRGYDLAIKGIAISRAMGIPFVYEVRSFHEQTWAAADIVSASAELTMLRIAQENRCMSAADHVVTISETMREHLIIRGVAEQKITVVPNAVDNDFLADGDVPPAKISGIEDTDVVLGYISNMSKREGHAILLHAVSLLARQGQPVKCLLVGDGPERESLKALASKLQIRNRVLFAGAVPHHEIKSYYSAIDIFVTPRITDYAGDFVTPLKPYEAMAMRRPLVVSDAPALREIVGAEERGRIFLRGDATHLAAVVADMIHNEEATREMAGSARAWVKANRTWDRNAAIYSSLYTQLIARRATVKGTRREDATA